MKTICPPGYHHNGFSDHIVAVFLSAEGAKNVSWSWLSPLCGWGSVTMTFTGKFVYGSPFHIATVQCL